MSKMFLGEPPANIKQWIIDHNDSPSYPETTIELTDGTKASYDWTEITIQNFASADYCLAEEMMGSWSILEWTKDIQSIEIGSQVSSIARSSLNACPVKYISISKNGVDHIDINAFSGSAVKNVKLPNGITSIYNYGFSTCRNLSSINLPNSLTSIGSYAFSGNSSLSSINLPNSLTSIDSYAFQNCSNLNVIDIPDSVVSVGNLAFACLESKPGKIKTAIIGSGIQTLGDRAFQYQQDLSSVIFHGKTLAQVQEMQNYPWGISDTGIIYVA